MPILSAHKLRFAGGFGGAGAVTYQFFRLYITKWNFGGGQGDDGNLRIAEFELMVDSTAYPTENMTAANAPSPLVVSTDSDDGVRFGWMAFDGNLGPGDPYRWLSGSDNNTVHWLKIDLGAGNGIAPTSYKITPDDAVPSQYWLMSWQLQGSDTGAFAGEETVLDTQTDVNTGWTANTQRTFTIA